MLRNVLTRSRNSRMITLVCLVSICTNIVLLMSSRTTYKVVYKQLDREKYDLTLTSLVTGTQIEDRKDSIGPGTGHYQTQSSPSTAPTNSSINNINCTLCPYYPVDLLGPLADMTEDKTPEQLLTYFPEIREGRFKPSSCMARERVAIVIPYRNRYPHLHILLHNLIPFLTRQQADATIFVVEQALPGTFNRGALLNVGFLEAEKVAMFDCFIFHDVDLIPLDDRHLYRCGDNPKHFAVSMNKYKFRLPYRDYFGGAVAFSRHQYLDINGCSNLYFGWGGEDDEMLVRTTNIGYSITRSPVHIARYDMIKHTLDKGNEVNPVRKIFLSSARKRQSIEGLNTLKYQLNSLEYKPLYIWITVTFNETAILESAPPYILEAVIQSQKATTLAPSSHKNGSSALRSNMSDPSLKNVSVPPKILKRWKTAKIAQSNVTSMEARNLTVVKS